MKNLVCNNDRTIAVRFCTSAGSELDRLILNVLRDRNRFLKLLADMEDDSTLFEYRIEEGYGMSRSLARRAERCCTDLVAAENVRAAEVLADILYGDFRRATALCNGFRDRLAILDVFTSVSDL